MNFISETICVSFLYCKVENPTQKHQKQQEKYNEQSGGRSR